jgi:hypothetical protein
MQNSRTMPSSPCGMRSETFSCPGRVRVADAANAARDGRARTFTFTASVVFEGRKPDQASDAEWLCRIRAGECDSSFCKGWVKVAVAPVRSRGALIRNALRSVRLSTQDSRSQTTPAYALRASEGRHGLYHDRRHASSLQRLNPGTCSGNFLGSRAAQSTMPRIRFRALLSLSAPPAGRSGRASCRNAP